MPTRLDPFTGRPLEDPNREEPAAYQPVPGEPEDTDLHVSREELPVGFIRPGERQRGARFRAAMEIPAIMVGILTAVMVGVFALVLGVRGTLVAYERAVVPALLIGGSLAAIGGTLAALYLWPAWARQGPIRTIVYGLLASAFVFGIVVLGIGFAMR